VDWPHEVLLGVSDEQGFEVGRDADA